MDVKILELEKSDELELTSLNTLLVHLDKTAEPLTHDDVLSITESDATHLFVAKRLDTEETIGMITLVMFRIPFVKKGLIEDVVVHEQFRGKGIGKKLINHALLFALKHGVKYVDLTSRPERIEANKLYAELGFEKRNTNVYRKKLKE